MSIKERRTATAATKIKASVFLGSFGICTIRALCNGFASVRAKTPWFRSVMRMLISNEGPLARPLCASYL